MEAVRPYYNIVDREFIWTSGSHCQSCSFMCLWYVQQSPIHSHTMDQTIASLMHNLTVQHVHNYARLSPWRPTLSSHQIAWQLNRIAYRPCTACGIVSYSKTGTTHDSAAYLFSALNLEGLHLSWAAWTCYLSLHLLPICIQEYIYVDAQACIYSTYKSENVNVKQSPGCQSTKACYSKLMYNSVVSVGHSLRLHLWKDMKNEVWLMKAFEQKYYCYSCHMIYLRRKRQHRGKVAVKCHFYARVLFMRNMRGHIWSDEFVSHYISSHNNYASTTPTSCHAVTCT